MSTTAKRIDALATQKTWLEPWIGPYNSSSLSQLLKVQLGSPNCLDHWEPRGDTQARAFPRTPLLHILSGNTPHAAFQSVARALLVGARSRVKLPSEGIPIFEEWLASLPPLLADLIESRKDLPSEWLHSAAVVIFGSSSTIATFRKLIPPDVPRIEHGPKLSIGVVFEPTNTAAALAANDILTFDQRGCLSLQAIYVSGGEVAAREFAFKLSNALNDFRRREPRASLSLSEAGAISNSRELVRFRAANGEDMELWESNGDTSWTVAYQKDPTLAPGPLNGFVHVHPLPESGRLRSSLGPEIEWISTVAIHPFLDSLADQLEPLAAPRVCALGKAQSPPLFWHHDGRPPLADLVYWRDRR